MEEIATVFLCSGGILEDPDCPLWVRQQDVTDPDKICLYEIPKEIRKEEDCSSMKSGVSKEDCECYKEYKVSRRFLQRRKEDRD